MRYTVTTILPKTRRVSSRASACEKSTSGTTMSMTGVMPLAILASPLRIADSGAPNEPMIRNCCWNSCIRFISTDTPDVEPQVIAEGLFWGAFINTGQTCAALKRLYVHEDVYDAVCDALVDVARTMPMGVGLDEQNVLGPLQNRQQFDVVDRLVESAKASL